MQTTIRRYVETVYSCLSVRIFSENMVYMKITVVIKINNWDRVVKCEGFFKSNVFYFFTSTKDTPYKNKCYFMDFYRYINSLSK